MMNTSDCFKICKVPSGNRETITVSVKVKWWGGFVLAAKAIKKECKAKWYFWPYVWLYLYPRLVYKLVSGGAA